MKWMLTLLSVLPVLAQDVQVRKEQALGSSLAAEIKRQAPVLSNESAQRYVTELGQALVGQLDNPRLTCRFEVIQSSNRDPVALPGGYILVPDASLREAGSEAEVVTLLAHAVAHVHLLKPATRPGTSIPLIFAGGPSGLHGVGGSLLVPAAFRETQQQREAEATEFGRQLAARFQWDSRSAVEFQAVREQLPLPRPEPKPPTLHRHRRP